jgi:hypothetical protein
MTNFTTKMMIAATTVLVAATCASAQTLKADIPFNFRVSEKVLPAGTYKISDLAVLTGSKIFRISGPENTVLAISRGASDVDRSWQAKGLPTLSFECVESRCSLVKLWTGTGDAYAIPHPKPGPGEPVRMATVVMHADKAD